MVAGNRWQLYTCPHSRPGSQTSSLLIFLNTVTGLWLPQLVAWAAHAHYCVRSPVLLPSCAAPCYDNVHSCSCMCVQSTEALRSLLAAVPDMAPGPYIVVGHSAGGQLALQYAAKHRSDVAGLALLDRWVTGAAGFLHRNQSDTRDQVIPGTLRRYIDGSTSLLSMLPCMWVSDNFMLLDQMAGIGINMSPAHSTRSNC